MKKLEERGEYLTDEELNDEFKLYEMYLEEVSKYFLKKIKSFKKSVQKFNKFLEYI
jgi:uncharacterized protein YnzC (UPF0291/DUF896 family)